MKMTSLINIFNQILIDICPKPEEIYAINEIVDVTKTLLENSARELKIDYTIIEPQGSTGIKQTQLRNDFDIDIFIGLNYNLYEDKFKGLSKTKLKKESKKEFLKLCNEWIIKALILKEYKEHRLLYAEHPYVTVDFIDLDKNLKIKLDIVLYFDLTLEFIKKNGIITAVDRSPWHGRFVRDNLSKKQKDDVRLLKQFFKSCHCYGDKSAAGKMGFIGYSAELLIYHFKSIENVFNNFKNLPSTPLDYFKRNKKELRNIPHFKDEFLIITDPVDSNRNVASAISERAYNFCNHRIKQFLKTPETSFFKITPIPEMDLAEIDQYYFIMEIRNTDPNVHYTINRDKLYLLGEQIISNGEKEFTGEERFGTIIFEVYFKNDLAEFNIAIYCSKPIISDAYARRGPPIEDNLHSKRFKQKNPDYYEKEGFLWVKTERKHVNFIDFLIEFIKNKIPQNLHVINVSNAYNAITSSAKKALYVLKNMVLPFNKN